MIISEDEAWPGVFVLMSKVAPSKVNKCIKQRLILRLSLKVLVA